MLFHPAEVVLLQDNEIMTFESNHLLQKLGQLHRWFHRSIYRTASSCTAYPDTRFRIFSPKIYSNALPGTYRLITFYFGAPLNVIPEFNLSPKVQAIIPSILSSAYHSKESNVNESVCGHNDVAIRGSKIRGRIDTLIA